MKTRIPKDVRISEIVAWAEQIGCIVEIRLIEKGSEHVELTEKSVENAQMRQGVQVESTPENDVQEMP